MSARTEDSVLSSSAMTYALYKFSGYEYVLVKPAMRDDEEEPDDSIESDWLNAGAVMFCILVKDIDCVQLAFLEPDEVWIVEVMLRERVAASVK